MGKKKIEVQILDCQVRISTPVIKGGPVANVIPLFESGELVEFEIGSVEDGSVTVLWRPKGQKVKKGK